MYDNFHRIRSYVCLIFSFFCEMGICMYAKSLLLDILTKCSDLYIFGTADVGRRLLDIVDRLGFSEKFRGFVVSRNALQTEIQGFAVYNLSEFRGGGKKDTILVSVSRVYHPDVFSGLVKYFDNVVPAHGFFSLPLPDNHEIVPNIQYLDLEVSEHSKAIRDKIVSLYYSVSHVFGGGGFYQSLPSLGIPGVRPTDIRISEYDITHYLHRTDNVVDIGCNCGFFDIELSSFVNHIIGVEYDEYLVDFANQVANILGISNLAFESGDFNVWHRNNYRKFDCVISSAVHIWIGMSPREYAVALSDLLTIGGTLLFESHNIETDRLFFDFCDELHKRGMVTVKSGRVNDTGVTNREFQIMVKQ